MSDIKARYVGGSMTGVDVVVRLEYGEEHTIHVKHGGELPTELPDGRKIPKSVRDGLLEQTDNWTEVKRSTDTSSKSAAAEKDGE